MFFEKFQILPPNPGQIYDAGLKIETGCELGSLNHEELPEALDLSSSGLAATWPLLASEQGGDSPDCLGLARGLARGAAQGETHGHQSRGRGSLWPVPETASLEGAI